MNDGLPKEPITVVLTRQELLEALRSRPRPWEHQDQLRCVVGAVAFAAMATILNWGLASTIALLLVLTLFYVLRHRLALLMPSARSARKYRFDTTGIDVAWGRRQRHFSWSQFRGTTRTKDAAVLWLTRRVAFVLPERCFPSPEQAAAIVYAVES